MLYLASRSPRRQQLLQQLNLAFEVLPVEVPEVPRADELPADYVRRVALAKARAGRESLGAHAAQAWVLGADTEVVLDGEVFGKPVDAADAAGMLRRLSGRTHTVLSALWLVGDGREMAALCTSRVTFAALTPADIHDYVAGGECMGKAGAYAIQGQAAAFISHLEGSYSGVMGLPLYETAQLLRASPVSGAVTSAR